jgi:hypothetical protein
MSVVFFKHATSNSGRLRLLSTGTLVDAIQVDSPLRPQDRTLPFKVKVHCQMGTNVLPPLRV